MEKVKKSVLLVLAFFVFLIVTGGEYASNLLEQKAQAATDVAEESHEPLPNSAELTVDIFNSVIQVSHLVFHSDLIFEFDLPEINETKPHAVFKIALNFFNYQKTLFRSIISPNAP